MGYPGTGQAGDFEDLNAERSYKTMQVHMNTVAGNEILVLDLAKRYPRINFYGLNPGFVKTNIRSNLLGEGSVKFRLLESVVGFFTPTPEQFAKRLTPLFATKDIENISGSMFNRKGQGIIPSDRITPDHARKFIKASEELIARKTNLQI